MMDSEWKNVVYSLENGAAIETAIDQNGIVLSKVSDSDSYLFHKNHTKGAYLRKLKENRFHQIYWETPYYTKVLDKFLNDYDFRGKTILDFGCGDGRFTQYLLGRGAERIVCVDFDYGTLASLSGYAEEHGLSEKLLIVHSDYNNLAVNTGEVDLVLAIGVLYYLNDNYDSAIRRFHSLLKPGGRMITSDPELEGSLLRMLMYDSLDAAIQTFKSRRFKETKDETEYKFRVFDQAEWETIFKNAGFSVKGHHGVSLFHNLIRVLQLKGIIAETDLEKHESEIWEILDYLHDHGKLFKHIMWDLTK